MIEHFQRWGNIDIIYLDFAKALDTESHCQLLRKLNMGSMEHLDLVVGVLEEQEAVNGDKVKL